MKEQRGPRDQVCIYKVFVMMVYGRQTRVDCLDERSCRRLSVQFVRGQLKRIQRRV